MLPHYEIHDGAGPPLLLVHGFLSSRAQWRLNLEALQAVCRPVVLELWGHGRSPAPDDPALYRVSAYIAAFEEIRRRLGAERWFVCGQSFGAGLTMRYALEHSGRVPGQVVTNSVSAFSNMDQTGRIDRALAVEKGGRAALEAWPIHPRKARRLPEAVRDALWADADLLDPASVALSMRHTAPGLAIVDDMPSFTVTTLLVNGLREAAFQPLRKRAETEIPDCRVVDLDGGHSVNIDAAEGFNEAVCAFIWERSG